MSDIVFVNCARNPSEIIFRERLEHMASRVPGIDLKWVVERPEPFRPWTGYRGIFNQLMLGLMAPDYLEREVFCCGPEPFMRAVREALTGLGYDMDRYHQESFQAPAATKAEVPVLDDVLPEAGAQVELTFATSGVTAHVAETDTILAAARANGLNIPRAAPSASAAPARSASSRVRCTWSTTAASRRMTSPRAIFLPAVRIRLARCRSMCDTLEGVWKRNSHG